MHALVQCQDQVRLRLCGPAGYDAGFHAVQAARLRVQTRMNMRYDLGVDEGIHCMDMTNCSGYGQQVLEAGR